MTKKKWLILLIAALVIAAIALAGILLSDRAPIVTEATPTPVPDPTPTPYREILYPTGDVVPLTDEESKPTPTPDANATALPENTDKPTDAENNKATGTPAATATPIPGQANTTYDYALLTQNAEALLARFPEKLTRISLGTTAFGRDIFCLRLGNAQAEHKILLIAGVRGNETGMSLVMMKQIETYLTDTTSLFRGKTYQTVLDKACLYFIPMLNPDGAELCLHGLSSVPASEQSAVAGLLEDSLAQGLISALPGADDAIGAWSANGRGVEVAYNFGSGIVTTSEIVSEPACAKYPGQPFVSEEAQAVRKLCEETDFALLALFSGVGDTIDWSFGQSDGALTRTLAWGVSQSSSYAVVENGPTPDNCVTVEAHQWFIQTYHKPAMKIASGSTQPYPTSQIVDAWRSLSAVPLYLADKAQWSYESQDDVTDATPDANEPGFEYDEID